PCIPPHTYPITSNRPDLMYTGTLSGAKRAQTPEKSPISFPRELIRTALLTDNAPGCNLFPQDSIKCLRTCTGVESHSSIALASLSRFTGRPFLLHNGCSANVSAKRIRSRADQEDESETPTSRSTSPRQPPGREPVRLTAPP